jgi:hypothetical protein
MDKILNLQSSFLHLEVTASIIKAPLRTEPTEIIEHTTFFNFSSPSLKNYLTLLLPFATLLSNRCWGRLDSRANCLRCPWVGERHAPTTLPKQVGRGDLAPLPGHFYFLFFPGPDFFVLIFAIFSASSKLLINAVLRPDLESLGTNDLLGRLSRRGGI